MIFLKKSIVKNKFVSGIVILVLAQILTKILGLIYTLYLVNKKGFGDSGNAIYASGYQIYALLLTLSSIGVPNAISKMTSEKLADGNWKGAYRNFKVALATFCFIGFSGTVTLYLFSYYIANYLIQIPEAELTLKILSPALLFVSMASVFKGFYNGMENMKITAKSQIIEQITKTLFTILFVEIIANISNISTKYMAAGATLATTFATLFGFIYLIRYYIICRKYLANNIKNSINYKYERVYNIVKKIIKISTPIALSAIMASLTKNIDSITVVRELKNFLSEEESKLQYGILGGKIETLVTLPLSLNIAFSTALVPSISASKVNGKNMDIQEKIKFCVSIGMLIGIPCIFGLNFFAREILNLLFPNASSGIEILKISSFSIVFVILTQTISGALQGLGKEFVPAKAYGIGIIIKIICNITLIKIPFLGIKGAAIGTVFCNITAFFIVYESLKKITGIKLELYNHIIKPIFVSIIMCITSYYILFFLKGIIKEKIAIIISLIFAVIIYASLMTFFKIIFCKKTREK